MVPYFGGRLTFEVIGVDPVDSDALQVTQNTTFYIMNVQNGRKSSAIY